MSPFDTCVAVMNEVAEAIERGHKVTWIPIQKELRWIWRDEETQKEWAIKVSTARRIVGVDVIHRAIVVDFITNKKDAVQAKKWLAKIDNLKVFL